VIKAVFLDLWDTLIYSEPGPIETYTRMELESITKTLSRVKTSILIELQERIEY